MKILDKILYQRLDKIRDELNLYIVERIEDDICEASEPIVEPIIRHESVGGTIGKLLDAMRLEDNDDFDFANEEYYEDDEEEQIHSAPMQSIYAPMQSMSSPKSVEIPIPDFPHSEC